MVLCILVVSLRDRLKWYQAEQFNYLISLNFPNFQLSRTKNLASLYTVVADFLAVAHAMCMG